MIIMVSQSNGLNKFLDSCCSLCFIASISYRVALTFLVVAMTFFLAFSQLILLHCWFSSLSSD
uniref:Uncharacterized protein n=1 Tax=Rhizophora mucronata TaxID=61149 RepID=A0A2P2QCS6_RHIMU